MVQWSGGGGFGHYAWLLADALGATGTDVVLATRRTHELVALPRHHSVLPVWADAPADTRSPRRRRASILVAFVRGWLWVTVAVARSGPRRSIVHLQAADRFRELPFLWALRGLGATVVVTVHNERPHDTGRWGRLKLRLLYRVPHAFFAHTDAIAAEVGRQAGRPRPVRQVRHPSFLDIVDHLATAAPPGPDAPPTVAHLGTIRPYKQLPRVVDAVANVRRSHPDVRLVVVGNAFGVPSVDATVAAIPTDHVRVDLGHLPIARLVDEARSADVVMLGHQSTSESGIAHLALGAGAAVVGPRLAAIERLLAAAEPGWLYDPDDPLDPARVLRNVLADVSEDRAAVRRRARSVAESVPSWTELARETLEFVDSVRAVRP